MLDSGATPVLVEGALDAIAVTTATSGRYVGLAPLGTALTEEHVHQLGELGRNVVIGTDNDTAGRAAAEHSYWALTPYGLDPQRLILPEGSDPATVLHQHGPAGLQQALDRARPLGELLAEHALATASGPAGGAAAVHVLAARPPASWNDGVNRIIEATRGDRNTLTNELASALLKPAQPAGVASWAGLRQRRTNSLQRERRALDPTPVAAPSRGR